MKQPGSFLADTLAALALAVAFIWPAMANGGPFWFPDTTTYIRAADAAVVYLTDQRSEWSNKIVAVSADDAQGEPVAATAAAETGEAAKATQYMPTRPVLEGRSIYYGFLLYIPLLLAGPWAAVLLQGLITAALLIFNLRIAARVWPLWRPKPLAIGAAILVALTPLPYYVSMLMPDIYSGLIILTMTTGVVFWKEMRLVEKLFVIGACALMAMFHTSHILLAAVIAIAGTLFYLRSKEALRPIGLAAAIIPIALVGNAAFNLSVEKATGITPISPPFLTARLSDGPAGPAYLDRHCDGGVDQFAICKYRQQLPMKSDGFLWNEGTEHGPETALFQLLQPAEQIALAQQDKRFFLAVALDDPIAFGAASIRAFGEQLVFFGLENFNYPTTRLKHLDVKYPEAIADQIRASRAAQQTMPVQFTIGATIAVAIASLGIAVWKASRILRRQSSFSQQAMIYLSIILLALLANAFICGALSGPHARYQMRLIWLLPYVAWFGMVLSSIARGNSQTSSIEPEVVTP